MPFVNKEAAKKWIAQRAAKEFEDGQVVNLGIGLPSLIPEYVDRSIQINFQSENGMVGFCEDRKGGEGYIVNAAGSPAAIQNDGAFFDSIVSFGMIRGGHVDVTVLGGYQVDEHGNLANWYIPGQAVSGMGGAMDCVTGAKKVIVTMLHTQNGKPKIVRECTLPLTARNKVDRIITEMAVIDVTENGLILREVNPVYTVAEVLAVTEARLKLT